MKKQKTVNLNLLASKMVELALNEGQTIKVSCPSFRRVALLAKEVYSILIQRKILFSGTRRSDQWVFGVGNSKIEFIPRDGRDGRFGNSAEYIIELN